MRLKQEQWIVGLDPNQSYVRIMRVRGGDLDSAETKFFPFSSELFRRADYSGMLNGALETFLEQRPARQSVSVTLVLPNNLVGTDVLTLPTMKRSAMREALSAQMKELYRNFEELKINLLPLSSSKSSQSFQAVMVKKDVLAALYRTLAEHKLYPGLCTTSAAGALAAAFHLSPKLRRKNFIFLNLRADTAGFVLCGNGTVVGVDSLPFGHSILKSESVLRETLLYDRDVAYLAVQNAVERARQTRLSEAFDPDAASASDIIDENALRTSPAEDSDDVQESEHGADNEHAEQEAERKVKTFVRKVRRLPAYLTRPVPETREGIVYENFRIFVKKALLMRRHCLESAVLPALEFVVVNLPAAYHFLFDDIRREGQGMEFLPLESRPAGDAAEHLDLCGALYAAGLKGCGF